MKIENEFIPYEQALQLKELGFDEPCICCYDIEEKALFHCLVNNVKNNTLIDCTIGLNPKEDIKAPTYSQVFRWFREKCKLRFSIIDDHSDNDKPYSFTTEHEYYYDTGSGNDWFRTYEEAEIEWIS